MFCAKPWVWFQGPPYFWLLYLSAKNYTRLEMKVETVHSEKHRQPWGCQVSLDPGRWKTPTSDWYHLVLMGRIQPQGRQLPLLWGNMCWGNGRKREREWKEEGQRGSWAVERGRSQELKVMKNRLKWLACLPHRAIVISRPSSYSGQHLGFWPCCSHGLCWQLWLLLLSKVPRVWVTTCDHVGIRGHSYLSVLHCHWGHAVAEGCV